MSPREGFGIVVRTVGLGLVLHGVARALGAIAVGVWSIHGLWLHLILAIGVGVWMLSGARPLVAWAYKSEG
jgi:hypothetical protein